MRYEYWLEIGSDSQYFASEDEGRLALMSCGHPQAKLKRGQVLQDEDGDYFADVTEFDQKREKWINEQ